ncbi:SdpI family protein [Kocuria rhizophila]|uniref:SdpI family protein n=1 Tax=Kocuria rhizophila TaxID=72000 RepID=UPI003D6F8E72
MHESSIGALISIVSSLVVIAILYGVTRAGATGGMGRNSAVGIRTRATKRSDAAWQAGHAAALPVVRILCLALLVLDVGCGALVLLGPTVLVPWLGLIPAAGIVVAAVITSRAAAQGADAAQ